MYIIKDVLGKILKVSILEENEWMTFMENYPEDLIMNPSKYLCINDVIVDNPDYIEPVKEELPE